MESEEEVFCPRCISFDTVDCEGAEEESWHLPCDYFVEVGKEEEDG